MKLYTQTIYGHRREVGAYDETAKVACFPVYWDKHFFRKANAWGIDEDVFSRLKELGCQKIIIKTDKTGEKYESTFKDFDMHSWLHIFSNFAPRRFMALERWQYTPPMSREEIEKEIFLNSEALI